ncbi:unnamed protein product [Alopecurus aequalis]
MAGVKPSTNLFAFLNRNDPGDFEAGKSTATPAAASLTKELFGHAYPSTREYIIRQNQMERQAWAEKRASDSNVIQGSGAKGAGYNGNGTARRQRLNMAVNKVPAEDKVVPPPPPPSLYDINQFPSLK